MPMVRWPSNTEGRTAGNAEFGSGWTVTEAEVDQIAAIGFTLLFTSLGMGGMGWLAWLLTDEPDPTKARSHGARVGAARLQDVRDFRKMVWLAPVGLVIFLVGLLLG